MFIRGSYCSFADVLARLAPSETQFRPQKPRFENYSALLKSGIYIVLVTHLLACILFYLGHPNLDAPDCGVYVENKTTINCGWVSKQNIDHTTTHTNYIAALCASPPQLVIVRTLCI